MADSDHGQPVGDGLGGWAPPPDLPEHRTLTGTNVLVEPLDASEHAQPLFNALSGAPDSIWTYMGFGPFKTDDDLENSLQAMVDAPDWLPYVFVVDGRLAGFASYLRIQPRDGVIEIGSIVLSPALQQTTAATEGLFLMIEHAFSEGYRRVEWKCDDLNAPSTRAAERLGFTYEGTFRKATHYKGRNRDTAWYAIVDSEWPALERSFRSWLSHDNFDDTGQQKRRLEEMR